MSGLLEVLGTVVVTVFAGLVLYGIYWISINLLSDFVNRRLVELYKNKDNLWLGVEDLYEDLDTLKEKVWDYKETKAKLKVAMKDIESLEEYVLESYKTNNK